MLECEHVHVPHFNNDSNHSDSKFSNAMFGFESQLPEFRQIALSTDRLIWGLWAGVVWVGAVSTRLITACFHGHFEN